MGTPNYKIWMTSTCRYIILNYTWQYDLFCFHRITFYHTIKMLIVLRLKGDQNTFLFYTDIMMGENYSITIVKIIMFFSYPFFNAVIFYIWLNCLKISYINFSKFYNFSNYTYLFYKTHIKFIQLKNILISFSSQFVFPFQLYIKKEVNIIYIKKKRSTKNEYNLTNYIFKKLLML